MKSKEVICDRVVIGDGQFYPSTHLMELAQEAKCKTDL
jgi:hypothetical protein